MTKPHSMTTGPYPMTHCRFYGVDCAKGQCLDEGDPPECYKPRWTTCPRCGGNYDHLAAMGNVGCLCETDLVDGPQWQPKDHWAEHPWIPVRDWQAEVANDDTRLGYHEWVRARLENDNLTS